MRLKFFLRGSDAHTHTPGFLTGFFFLAGGGDFFGDSKQICVKQMACKPHPSGGGGGGGLGACPHWKTFEKNSCPEIKSGGFGDLWSKNNSNKYH